MSITTFAQLIADSRSEKIALVEAQPTKPLVAWTQHAGDVYYSAIEIVKLRDLTERGVSLSEVFSLDDMDAGK